MPTTEKLYADYKEQGLVILAVDVDETRETVDKFLKTRPVGYPVLMGSESVFSRVWSDGLSDVRVDWSRWKNCGAPVRI
jgi:hypothetical protein